MLHEQAVRSVLVVQGNSEGDHAASPAQQPLDGSEADGEDMLELPDGFNPTHIPMRCNAQPHSV